jgi:tetratricopeptide (TPR) repeat protein
MKKTLILCIILQIAVLPFVICSQAGAENWYDNGVSSLNAGKYEEAIKAFSLSIETLPHDYESYNKRGVAFVGTGDLERAIADFTKAVELNPEFGDALSNRCAALCDRGNFEDAIKDCGKAIEINPRSAKAFNNRGIALSNTGDVEKAIADYGRAIEINPGYADPHNNLAWIYATCPDKNFRNGEKALAYARKAVRISSDPYYLDTLAAALAENGRFDEAIEIQEKVVASADGKTRNLYNEHLELYEANLPLRDKRQLMAKKEKIEETVKQPNPPPPSVEISVPAYSVSEPVYDLFCKGDCPFSIQVASFKDYDTSYKETLKLRKKIKTAFTSYVSAKNGKTSWYRVLVGAYKTKEEAQNAVMELKDKGIEGAVAVKTPYVIFIGGAPSGKKIKDLESDKFTYYRLKGGKGMEKTVIGAFETEKDAKYFSARLKKKGYKTTVGKR